MPGYAGVTQSSSGARFTNGFLPSIQIRWKFRLAIIPLLAISLAKNFCTCHDSTAVVPRTKFCSDHCIRIEVRVKRNIRRIWFAMEKPLVKRPLAGVEARLAGHKYSAKVYPAPCHMIATLLGLGYYARVTAPRTNRALHTLELPYHDDPCGQLV